MEKEQFKELIFEIISFSVLFLSKLLPCQCLVTLKYGRGLEL